MYTSWIFGATFASVNNQTLLAKVLFGIGGRCLVLLDGIPWGQYMYFLLQVVYTTTAQGWLSYASVSDRSNRSFNSNIFIRWPFCSGATAWVTGLSSADSGYLQQSALCISHHTHWDLPALMTAIQYFTQYEVRKPPGTRCSVQGNVALLFHAGVLQQVFLLTTTVNEHLFMVTVERAW